MKLLTLSTVLAVCALAGCSTTSNTSNARGANTNTGYLTNAETNSKPAVTSNVTNVSPGNVAGGVSNSMSSGNSSSSGNANHSNSNTSH